MSDGNKTILISLFFGGAAGYLIVGNATFSIGWCSSVAIAYLWIEFFGDE